MQLGSCCAFFILIGASVTAAPAPNQFVARYESFGESSGTSGSADLLAVDASGNFFIVGTVTEPSGRPQIRAVKTDPQGNVLAQFDFGASGQNLPDAPAGAAVDPQGDLVIVGTTYLQNFPLVSPLISQSSQQAGFIVKLDANLTKILFSTRLGGSPDPNPLLPYEFDPKGSSANAVALDAQGNIYVAGTTRASDFPITPGAFQTTGPPQNDIFVTPLYGFITELSPDGASIVYSTFFGAPDVFCDGGSSCLPVAGMTGPTAIAVDPSGAIVIGGNTTAVGLPVTAGTIGQTCNCIDSPSQAAYATAGFLAKFAPGGGSLAWATYINLGPEGLTEEFQQSVSITAVALDAEGNVVIAGTAPSGFSITNGALQSSYPGGQPGTGGPTAGFVAKLNASATSYLFSTYFGGLLQYATPDGVTALSLDSQGDIWLTGGSVPSVLPFPTSIPVFGPTYLAELSPDGSSLVEAITAPTGAAGQAIVMTPSGSPAVLGSAGSLLLDLPDQPAALIAVENSAGVQVTGNIAPYELVSFYGIGLGPAKPLGAQVVNGTVTSSLGGVQVLFNNVAAPLLYVGPNQINAIVPASVFGQDTASVQIVTPNGTLTGPTLAVVPSEPEVFQAPATSLTPGAAVALNEDGSLNSASSPAAAGSIVTVWATGAGGSNFSNNPDGFIATTLSAPSLPVSVLAGNLNSGYYYGGYDSLEVLYAGDAPGMVSGVIQVNFRLSAIGPYPGEGQISYSLQVGAAVSSPFEIYVKQ